MRTRLSTYGLCISLAAGCLLLAAQSERWGFFAHKRINQMAVFTLPPELIVFFKQHIAYITDHAVDPDKRRYAVRGEAIRHYIDLDQWGKPPFTELPRTLPAAVLREGEWALITQNQDTLVFCSRWPDSLLQGSRTLESPLLKRGLQVSADSLQDILQEALSWQLGAGVYSFPMQRLQAHFPAEAFRQPIRGICFIDHFAEHGVLPYILPIVQRRLTYAFKRKDVQQILKYAADIGHYIGDAHVPLHTTKNYNGQLTDQVGIHAFWESRLPELYADAEYDFFVGKAAYIDRPEDFYWTTIFKSHTFLDSVLLIEKELSLSYPSDRQFCYEERLNQLVRTQCAEYAGLYNSRLDGMVEQRFRSAVLSVGSIWYTCWVDAGQPDLSGLGQFIPSAQDLKEAEELDAKYRSGQGQGRDHE